MSAFYGGRVSEEENFAVLDLAADQGCTFWDTSDVYGPKLNELLLGKWFKRTGRRNEIVLGTKFGSYIDDQGFHVRGDAEYVKQACEGSLSRLGVSSIDLYYCHRIDMTIPIEETVGAMKELVEQGKVKYLGLSECSADTLRRAYKVHPIAAVQIEYSPFTVDIETKEVGLLQACRELGVATVDYSPLGRGMLTGQYKSAKDFGEDDFRSFMPRFSEENFPKNMALVEEIAKVGAEVGATPGQTTLAWLLAQGEDIIPIPGTKKEKYLLENVAAAKVKLSSDQVARIRKAVENATVYGTRYDAAHMQILFADTPPL